MSEKITFKNWLANIGKSIWQAICWIGRGFNPKYKSPFWRVIWVMITLCIVILTVAIAYVCHYEFERRSPWFHEQRYDPKLSADYKFRNNGYGLGKSFIYNRHTGKKVLKGIDWIARSFDNDQLVVVAKNGKRGFLNRFTGKMELPFKYDAAWVFSGGVAAVCEGDSVYFIDHSGKPINKRKYLRNKSYNYYTYHGNFAAIPENGKYGLVDRSGNWVYNPEYGNIEIAPRNMWYAKKNGKVGVIGSDGKFVVPCEYENIKIYPDSGIYVDMEDHTRKRLDYEGNVVDDFVFDNMRAIKYKPEVLNEDSDPNQFASDIIYQYNVDNYYGLMTLNGRILTPPLYSSVGAIAPNIFQCHFADSKGSILLNSKGEKINN